MRTKEELRHDMKLRILAWAILIVPILLCAWSVKGQARGATGDTGPAGGQTAPARGVVAQTKPVADADAKAIAPLLEKATDIQKQMQQIVADANAKLNPLRIQLNGTDGKSGVEHDLSIAETDAYSHAKVDSRFTQIMKDASGKIVFAPRQQGVPNR